MHRPIVAAFLLISIQSGAWGQAPDTLWSRIHSISPDGDVDDGKCVRQTDDGGFVVTGSCVPDGVTSAIDVLLLKTDESGHIQWVKSFGREYVDEGLAVEQTSDGGYLAVGPIREDGAEPSDLWLVKVDAAGEEEWVTTLGGADFDFPTSVRQTSDGAYVVAGWTMSSGAGGTDCWVVKFR